MASGVIVLQEGPRSGGASKYDQEPLYASDLSLQVEMALIYSSKKLGNLVNLLLCVVSEENDIESIDIAANHDDDTSCEFFFEKAFTVDLLYSISNLELTEVEKAMKNLQDLISSAIITLSASDISNLLHHGLLPKLRDSEEILKDSRESVSEMKIQLAKLQMNSVILRHDEWKHETVIGAKEDFLRSESEESRPGIEKLEQGRVLRMLERSLTRESELEENLLEGKRNGEDLKSKNLLLERASFSMEEASRLLEADSASTVLMGVSKDTLEMFRVSHFGPGDSGSKEEEINEKLEDYRSQLNICRLATDSAELTRLREKVEILEKNLETSESRVKESYSSNEVLRNQIKEMNFEIESLRESLHEAEEKGSHLTDSNTKLTKEIDFLKDTNIKEVGLLEEHLQELEDQFEHARASSEAIWDMETLIDELKQKVSNGEKRTEILEERNATLSEKNEALEKELGILRPKVDLDRKEIAKDIRLKTSLIMDTAMQIGSERELLLKKVKCLIEENKALRIKLRIRKKDSSAIIIEDNAKNVKAWVLVMAAVVALLSILASKYLLQTE